jgi:hypothetical protein
MDSKSKQRAVGTLSRFFDVLRTPEVQKGLRSRVQEVQEKAQNDMLVRAAQQGDPKATSMANQLLDQLGTASDITEKVPGLGPATNVLKGLDFANQLRKATGQVLANTAEQFAPGATKLPQIQNLLGVFGAGSPDILKEKQFPENFPDDALDIIRIMAYDDGTVEIMGSQNLRSQLYALDYDLSEIVKTEYKHNGIALSKFVTEFQKKVAQLVRHPNTYIGDIKAGLVPMWEIIPEESYIQGNTISFFSAEQSLLRLEEMNDANLLTDQEYRDFKQRLSDPITPESFVQLKKDARFHIVRWTPEDVARGSVKLLDGSSMSLQYAFCCPSIIKVDAVAYLESSQRFTEFSIIYQFQNRSTVFNRFVMDYEKELKQNLFYYVTEGKYFKVAKRLFSLARNSENTADLTKLNSILNSDLGILYSIVGDSETILFLLENHKTVPVQKIRDSLEGFRVRLANIYSVDADTPSVLSRILKMEELPATLEGREKLHTQMTRLVTFFSTLLNTHAQVMLEENGFLPLSRQYRP